MFSSQVQQNRILVGSPLRHRRFALSTAGILLVLLVFAIVTFSFVLGDMRPDAVAVFLGSLVAASFLSLVPLAILWWLDRRERESPWLFVLAFLWGGLIATALALPINLAIFADIAQWIANNPSVRENLGSQAALLLGAPIAGPLVEEITKGIGVLLLFFLLRAEFDNMRDGFIYGAVIGTGFNWLEAPMYVAQGYAQFGDAPWELQLGGRFALFGLAGHALYSGLFGAFVGLARQTRHRLVRYVAPMVGLLLAMAAHAANNLLPLVATLVVAAIHAVWHLPAYFVKGAITATGELDPTLFVANSLAIIAASFIWTWLFNNAAGSILFATFVHAASNGMSANLPAFLDLQDPNVWFAFGVTAVLAVMLILFTRGRLGFSETGSV